MNKTYSILFLALLATIVVGQTTSANLASYQKAAPQTYPSFSNNDYHTDMNEIQRGIILGAAIAAVVIIGL